MKKLLLSVLLRYKYLSVLSLLALLLACQPSFVMQQSGNVARSLGVINGFEITRWNTRLILASSSIQVCSGPLKDVDDGTLNEVVAHGLAPFFRRSNSGGFADSLEKALGVATGSGQDYLVYIQLVDARSLWLGKVDANADYNQLQLLFTVADIRSGQVIDKVLVSATSSWLLLLGDDMQGLLEKPLQAIGRSLTGV